jgi:CheY-like chemotaxis protein
MTLPISDKPVTVLIVEDEVLLRMHAADVLEDAGYIVIQAENADQAVAILEARTDIKILMTDIEMPGTMDGVKLAHAVRNRWPPVKIVVVSGRVGKEQIVLPDGSLLFGKPFDASKIVAELRSLLAA